MTSNGTVRYYHQDALGSTRALSDATGQINSVYVYDPYGNIIFSSSGNQTPNPFRFAGEYTDAESGLQYLRARYYDPATEQFISKDPLTALTRRSYGYAADSPTNITDATGLCSWAPWAHDFCGKQAAHVVAQVSSTVAAVTSIAAFATGAVGLEPLAAGLEVVAIASSGVAAGADVLEGNPGKAALDLLGFTAGVGALRATLKAWQAQKAVTPAIAYILYKIGVNRLGPVTSQALRDALAVGRIASNWRLAAAGADLASAAFSVESLSVAYAADLGDSGSACF